MSEIKDGELLPMIGGPCDGNTCRVDRFFPMLDGGMLPGGTVVTKNGTRHAYKLDTEQRAWLYCGPDRSTP
ncbi:MAG: hypothetical protein KDB18_10175 [Salinibacterium sp.]|nr:hypothetical protein [Salinibacterium sp.]